MKFYNFVSNFLNIPELLVLVLSPKHEIIEVNKPFQFVCARNYEGIIHQNFFDFFLNNHLALPFSETDFNSQEQRTSYTTIDNANNTFHINWSLLPIKRSTKSSSIYMVIGIDITKQKLTEEKERTFRQYLEKIINTVPSYIFWKDKNSVFLGCNYLFAISAGLNDPEEIIGKTDYDLPWKKSESDAYIADDKKVIASKQPKMNIEEIQTLQDGTQITLLTSKVPFYNDQGEIIGVLAVYTDITERKKMELELKNAREKAEAGNKAKTEFIANMSHDIKTPIAGVVGMAKILESEGDTDKDREYGHVIHTSSKQLMLLINDILDVISADETSKEKLEFETFNIHDRLKHLEELMLSNLLIERIKLKIAIDPRVPEYFVGDRIKIDRILLNLASNALKFTHQGQIEINVGLLSSTNESAVIKITVSDTGIGIKQSEFDKIFGRFYRVNPSYNNKYEGHGIGLYLVQKYIALLGGSIDVESQLDKGTSFHITLPLKKAQKQENVEIDHPNKTIYTSSTNLDLKHSDGHATINQLKQISKTPLKGLLVEDDIVGRRIAKNYLQSAGFEIEAVENAESAFKLILDETFDFIVTDIGLPGMSGEKLAELIRHWEKINNHSRIPIIGLSAHGTNQEQQAKLAGMDELLSKPIDEPKIRKILQLFFPEQYNNIEEILPKKATIHQTAPSKLGIDLPQKEEQLFQLDQYPLFDERDGIEKANHNKELLLELLTTLLNETIDEDIKHLQNAHTTLNWDAIEKTAHKLKSGSLYCGLIRMRYACQFMERYCLAGHTKLLEQLYQQLLNVLSDTKKHMKLYLAQDNHSTSNQMTD